MGINNKARSKRSLRWAATLTVEERETFIRELAPLASHLQGVAAKFARMDRGFAASDVEELRDTQSKLAACRRLNRKEANGQLD